MDDAGGKLAGIVAAIISLAVLAIVVSNQANTANVLSAFFGGISNMLGMAISPITGKTPASLGSGLTGGTWTSNGSVSPQGVINQINSTAGNLVYV